MTIADVGCPGGPKLNGSDALIALGPTMFVDVGFNPKHHGGKAPSPPVTNVGALIDTGAYQSCIDITLATRIGLPVIDEQKVAGVGGKATMPVYMAQISFQIFPGISQFGLFTGADLAAGGALHLVLIGRTMLKHGILIYDGRTGNVTFSI